MNELPRQKLREIVLQYGRDVIDDDRRLEGLLRDICGEYKREIFVLVHALKLGVPQDLLVSRGNLPQEVILARLVNRLIDHFAFSEEAAGWGVDAWAFALGLIADPSSAAGLKAPYHKTSQAILDQVKTVNPKAQLRREALVLALETSLMLFMRVPTGEFWMGSKKSDAAAEEDEFPQHKVFLDEYWIGKYPVTNLQYQAFVEATAYQPPYHWKKGILPPDKENHPVVYVSWDDAQAFCRWASEVSGEKVRLPSEAEWEKAGRGVKGHIWPWGNQPPDKALCNFDENVRGTTPVGEYSPQGDSPYGCADMIGNVWEWTSTLYNPAFAYPYDAEDGRENPEARFMRVLRGGSYKTDAKGARCAYRYVGGGGGYPDKSPEFGFRVVVQPSKTLVQGER